MNHKDILIESASNILFIIRRAISEEKEQLSELKDLHDRNQKRLHDLDQELKKLDQSINSFMLKLLPVFGSSRLRRLHKERSVRLGERSRLQSELAILRRGAKDCITCVRKLEELGRGVKSASRSAQNLHSVMSHISQVVTLGNKSAFYRKSLHSDRAPVAIDLAKRYAALVSELTRSSQERVKLPAPGLIIPAEPISQDEIERARQHRIYLPIHQSQHDYALSLGAKKDKSKSYQRGKGKSYRRGESNIYVTLDQDLTPFQNLLPIAYRQRRPKLEFPPISPKAVGQNIWGIFSGQTWNRIRNINYEQSGQRCVVCGRQRGIYQDKLVNPNRTRQAQRRSTVECHEVWEWEHDGSAVGIQKLKSLMTLCVDCHMMFHGGYAVKVAGDYDNEQEAQELIEMRRLFATHLDEERLRLQVEAESHEWQDRKSVESWVIDLSYLAQQSYMQNETPVMGEAAAGHVSPDQIAGISFISDEGDFYEAREAEEIYQEMVARTLETTIPGRSSG